VQQAHKEDRITFTSLAPWPGEGRVCAEGRYLEGDVEKRAGIFIGPEFGTVQRADLVEAARECGDAAFDMFQKFLAHGLARCRFSKFVLRLEKCLCKPAFSLRARRI
jgi:hypothetical protein